MKDENKRREKDLSIYINRTTDTTMFLVIEEIIANASIPFNPKRNTTASNPKSKIRIIE